MIWLWCPHLNLTALVAKDEELPDGLPPCFHLTATSSEVHNSRVAR